METDIKFIDKLEYLHTCIFKYSNGNIRLNNWVDGEVGGNKVTMYWWDGIPFLPNTEKEVTVKSAVQLDTITYDFKVDNKTFGKVTIKSTKSLTYKFPKF